MAGNEVSVAKFIMDNLGKIALPNLGLVTSIKVPDVYSRDPSALVELEQIRQLTTENASKKADFYLNDRGVSAKQSGSSFLFNRVLRSNFLKLFGDLEITNSEQILSDFDALVTKVHEGAPRDFHWSAVMEEESFSQLLEYLMMIGSPKGGVSSFPAEFILTAPSVIRSASDIEVLDFPGYFAKYASKIFFSIRRQWCGQTSETEHKRALSIARNSGNAPWVFDTISGAPSGWRANWPVSERRTVYMLYIQVIP